MNQPDYHEPILRFDVYSVVYKREVPHVTQMFKNLSWLATEIIAGMEHEDFCRVMTNTGWVGNCPEWNEARPIVVVPRKEILSLEQLYFILENT